MSVSAIEIMPKLDCPRCIKDRVLTEFKLCLACTSHYERVLKRFRDLSVDEYIRLYPVRHSPSVKSKKREVEKRGRKKCIRCSLVGKLSEQGLCVYHCQISFRRRSEVHKKKYDEVLSLTEYLTRFPFRPRKRNGKWPGFQAQDKGRDGLAVSITDEQVASLVRAAKSCITLYQETRCKNPQCVTECLFRQALVAQKVNLSLYRLTPTLK